MTHQTIAHPIAGHREIRMIGISDHEWHLQQWTIHETAIDCSIVDGNDHSSKVQLVGGTHLEFIASIIGAN